jgi:hypothetical protein
MRDEHNNGMGRENFCETELSTEFIYFESCPKKTMKKETEMSSITDV